MWSCSSHVSPLQLLQLDLNFCRTLIYLKTSSHPWTFLMAGSSPHPKWSCNANWFQIQFRMHGNYKINFWNNCPINALCSSLVWQLKKILQCLAKEFTVYANVVFLLQGICHGFEKRFPLSPVFWNTFPFFSGRPCDRMLLEFKIQYHFLFCKTMWSYVSWVLNSIPRGGGGVVSQAWLLLMFFYRF